jgi:hypothetical protein
MTLSVSVPISTKRANPTWLKDHQFKKGQGGRPKGTLSKLTTFTNNIFGKALLYDPETGNRWKSEEEAAKYWARRGGTDGRIQQEILNRALGKPAEKVDQTVTFVITQKEPNTVQVQPGNEVFTLPDPDSVDISDTSEVIDE